MSGLQFLELETANASVYQIKAAGRRSGHETHTKVSDPPTDVPYVSAADSVRVAHQYRFALPRSS
jgi:hypothetical protein